MMGSSPPAVVSHRNGVCLLVVWFVITSSTLGGFADGQVHETGQAIASRMPLPGLVLSNLGEHTYSVENCTGDESAPGRQVPTAPDPRGSAQQSAKANGSAEGSDKGLLPALLRMPTDKRTHNNEESASETLVVDPSVGSRRLSEEDQNTPGESVMEHEVEDALPAALLPSELVHATGDTAQDSADAGKTSVADSGINHTAQDDGEADDRKAREVEEAILEETTEQSNQEAQSTAEVSAFRRLHAEEHIASDAVGQEAPDRECEVEEDCQPRLVDEVKAAILEETTEQSSQEAQSTAEVSAFRRLHAEEHLASEVAEQDMSDRDCEVAEDCKPRLVDEVKAAILEETKEQSSRGAHSSAEVTAFRRLHAEEHLASDAVEQEAPEPDCKADGSCDCGHCNDTVSSIRKYRSADNSSSTNVLGDAQPSTSVSLRGATDMYL